MKRGGGVWDATSPPNPMTQTRFCLKRMNIRKESGESTLALLQIVAEFLAVVCVRDR